MSRAARRREDRDGDAWTVRERDLSAERGAGYETIYAQANGYRCLRGSSPFLPAAQSGNFIAGVFDKAEAQVTELVNCPDPLPITIYVDYESAAIGRAGFGGYLREYDLKRALVRASARFAAATGSELDMSMERFVSHGDRRRWAERWTFRARNFSRRILLRVGIDGGVVSNRSSPLEAAKHFEVLSAAALEDGRSGPWGICLRARTKDAGTEIAEAQAMTGRGGPRLVRIRSFAESVEAVWELDLSAGVPVTVERLGVTRGSRDLDGDLDVGAALRAFVAEGYDAEFSAHSRAVAKLWKDIDIAIEGDIRAQRCLRFNLLQLAGCAAPGDERASIGAKGLHGEGYKGHVFWDTETFMLPFFAFTQPLVARKLLGYRYLTLEGARENARAGGHAGARFAWESADDGRETTPRWGVNYAGDRARIWTGDIEVHIDADIAHAILKYYQASGDEEFMRERGLQVLLEIAAFWASFVEFDPRRDRYVIRDVIGPDEFHEHVDNNAYTNYLARWSIRRTLEIATHWRGSEPATLERIMERASVTEPDFARWREVAEKLFVPIGGESDLIEQFEGYFRLEEHPIVAWDRNGMPAWPAGVDLADLGGTTLIKQPDVVMLFALLGEDFDRETTIRNYDFYEKRTMHKSSLSPSIYATVGMSIGRTEHAYDYFIKAAETDLVDNQGNNAQGIHGANMGGVWQTAVFGFGGLSIDAEGRPRVDPWLPPHWTGLGYRFAWRGADVRVTIRPGSIEIEAERDIEVLVEGKAAVCRGGATTRFVRNAAARAG